MHKDHNAQAIDALFIYCGCPQLFCKKKNKKKKKANGGSSYRGRHLKGYMSSENSVREFYGLQHFEDVLFKTTN